VPLFDHQPTAPYRAHALVVLGRGLEADGSLPPFACQRVARAAELFAWEVAPRIIFTGRCSLNVQEEPPITEAAAMAAYAESLGIPRRVMHLEEEARDTIGNAYFTMTRWLEPNEWTSIRVVTSDFHMPRAAWVFQKVLGLGYDLAFSAAPSELDHTTVALRAREESDILTFLTEWIGPIRDGDPVALQDLIWRQHPGYATSPTVSREEIQARVNEIGRGHRSTDNKQHRGSRASQSRIGEM
jgi:vancomycin permeability regulator SanA